MSIDSVQQQKPKPRWRNLFSFSLKTFLFVVGLIAAFLAGRSSNQPIRMGDERPIGDWKMQMKVGWGRQVVIIETPGGDYDLHAADTVFNGIYTLTGNQLIMKTPDAGSHSEFVWEWDGEGWTLIKDTSQNQYIGSRLVPWGYFQRKKELGY